MGGNFSDLLYANVQVRSVSDDELATRPMLVGIASEQAHKYSQDLSASVNRGKRQQREEGARSGGPLMDGFVQIKHPHPTNPSGSSVSTASIPSANRSLT